MNNTISKGVNPTKIEREYPKYLNEKPYPSRYDKSLFEKLNELNISKLRSNYEKWNNGINYETNRKIKIGGPTHKKLKNNFTISYSCKNWMGCTSGKTVFFGDLIDINEKEYLEETKILNNLVDIENEPIKKYNEEVNNVIQKIKKLKRIDEFIEFEGKYYGIPSFVLNNIHHENDCFGVMEKGGLVEYECRACNLGVFSSSCSCYRYYSYKRCNKCGFMKQLNN